MLPDPSSRNPQARPTRRTSLFVMDLNTADPLSPGMMSMPSVMVSQRKVSPVSTSPSKKLMFTHVSATRGTRTLIAEAKGTTSAIGLDVDTAYGQLLRRMSDDPTTVYAVVVPLAAVKAALRVPEHVLAALRLSVFSVAKDGTVRLEGGQAL